MSFPNRRRDAEREERRIQRIQREDTAGKLLLRAPELTSLSLALHERRPEGCVSDNHYIRRIVVEHAHALFEIPCSYPQCEDGGYELTREILYALALQRERFEGEVPCGGQCGAHACTRVLQYVGTATYRETRGATDGPFLREPTTRPR